MGLSQFKLYIETETITQCFECFIFQILFSFDRQKVKKRFCILSMLRIHTGLWKLSKKNVYDLHLKQINPFDISKPSIKIAMSELLFEIYIMALNWYKYYIEV